LNPNNLREGLLVRTELFAAWAMLACLFAPSPAGAAAVIHVNPDGSADFTTVQAAVDSIPTTNSEPVEIHIAPGTYVEHVHVTGKKSFVSLIGTDPGTTKITYNTRMHDPAYTPWTAATVYFASWDFAIEGLSIENTFGVGEQSIAFASSGRRGQFRNVHFLSNQDTLLLYAGPFYLTNCRIEGTTDFMFGNATAWFENCELYSRSGNYLTASNCDISVPYGFVYNHCRLTRAATLGDHKVYLGRPWEDYASSVTYLNCWMDAHIRPEGWHDWGVPARRETCRYSEYNSWGPGGDMTNRVDWPGVHLLTAAEAASFSLPTVMNVPGVGPWMPTFADTSADQTAPLPDPLTWADAPHMSAAGTVSMSASLAGDINGVEYFFANVTDPSHDSGWQAHNTYTDTGLEIGRTYTYKVKARDLSVNHNQTGWSGEISVTMPDNPMQMEEVYLLPEDDSRLYVLGGTATHGGYDSLWARDLGSLSLMNTGILQFRLPADGRIFLKARLVLVNKRDNAGNPVRIFGLRDGVAGEDISEATVTYSNAPGVDAGTATLNADTVELYSAASGAVGTPITTPDGAAQEALNDFLRQDTNGIVTFYAASNTGAVQIGSKEAVESLRPSLHLWYLNNGCETVILGDIDANCRVEMKDFAIFASQWLDAPGTPPADIVPMGAADGVVGPEDLLQVVSDWLGGI
jgi:pectinesterase